jgi:hypothetical protein
MSTMFDHVFAHEILQLRKYSQSQVSLKKSHETNCEIVSQWSCALFLCFRCSSHQHSATSSSSNETDSSYLDSDLHPTNIGNTLLHYYRFGWFIPRSSTEICTSVWFPVHWNRRWLHYVNDDLLHAKSSSIVFRHEKVSKGSSIEIELHSTGDDRKEPMVQRSSTE